MHRYSREVHESVAPASNDNTTDPSAFRLWPDIARPDDYDVTACTLAEPRLEAAMRFGALIVVNQYMVVKGNGEALGMPLCDMQVEGGQLTVGTWYAPKQRADMLQIIRAYDEGATELLLPGTTDWYACRAVKWQEEPLQGEENRRYDYEALVRSLKMAVGSLRGGSTLAVDSCFVDGYYAVEIERRRYRKLCLASGGEAEPTIGPSA